MFNNYWPIALLIATLYVRFSSAFQPTLKQADAVWRDAVKVCDYPWYFINPHCTCTVRVLVVCLVCVCLLPHCFQWYITSKKDTSDFSMTIFNYFFGKVGDLSLSMHLQRVVFHMH